MTARRAERHHEFVAHDLKVNCARLGRKTASVMVTGGDDKRVNLWAVDRPNVILSLTGHNSEVESVCFDRDEEFVAAGAVNGSVKVWDLMEAKVVRSLAGHRANAISVDFHPYGEFCASGSLDTNLKIWDIRRKGCIHTYKGHTMGVNVVRFSPDGRWIVSGGEDGHVKLWDLTAGKLLHDFKVHEGPVTSVDFHPHEFLLATGSADRTIRFWDLETYELISAGGPEATAVRTVGFTPDGSSLLTGSTDCLRVWGWEPSQTYDVLDTGWGNKIQDLCAVAPDGYGPKVLACSCNQQSVGLWVIDLSSVPPFHRGNIAERSSPQRTQAPQRPGGNHKEISEALQQMCLKTAQEGSVAPLRSKRAALPKENCAPRSGSQGGKAAVPRAARDLPKGSVLEASSVGSGMAANALRPSRSQHSAGTTGGDLEGTYERQVVEEIEKHHDKVTAVLTGRLENLRSVRPLWDRGDVKEATAAMVAMEDPAAVVDVIAAITSSGIQSVTLETTLPLLPVLQELLSSQYNRHALLAVRAAQEVVKMFATIIRQTRAASPSVGVDLSLEARRERCETAYKGIRALCPGLEHLAAGRGHSQMDGADSALLQAEAQALLRDIEQQLP